MRGIKMIFRVLLSFILTTTITLAADGMQDCERQLSKYASGDSEFLDFASEYQEVNIYAQPGDTNRKVRNSSSPKWLDSVGSLKLNGVEICTVTLPKYEEHEELRVALTNYHCMTDVFKNSRISLSNYTVEFTSNNGKKIVRNFSDFYDGGSLRSDEDFAILILKESISTSDISGLEYEDTSPMDMRDSYTSLDAFGDEMTIKTFKETVAGHSGDINKDKGNSGKNLTYDDGCNSGKFDRDTDDKHQTYTANGCYAYPGASGGAYVTSFTDEYGDEYAILVGVNSASADESNSNDLNSFDRSKRQILPIRNFIYKLDSAVERFNK